MKTNIMILLLFFLLVTCNIAYSSKGDYKFFPNLPSGKYNIKFNAFSNCNPNKEDNKINFNWYLNKKTINSTEIKGSVTMKIPIDDSLMFNWEMAVRDSIGGWKDNAFVYKTPNACTVLKNFMGKSWTNFLESFDVKNYNCPVPAGNFTLLGFDTKYFQEANFPKTFFYGTYKLKFYYSFKTEKYACILAVIEIKRPWESL